MHVSWGFCYFLDFTERTNAECDGKPRGTRLWEQEERALGGFVSADARDAEVTAQRRARSKPPLLGQPRLRSYGDALRQRTPLRDSYPAGSRFTSAGAGQSLRGLRRPERTRAPHQALCLSAASAPAPRLLSPPPHGQRAAGSGHATRAAGARLRSASPAPSLAAGPAPPSTSAVAAAARPLLF